MGICCSKLSLYELPPGNVSQLYTAIRRSRTVRVPSDDCSRPGVEKTLPCRYVDIIKFRSYPRIVLQYFIQGIKQDIQDKISIQETRPDPRAAIHSNYPIQEEPKRCDRPPNVIFYRSNIKDKPPNIGGYKERLMKAFKNILCCCIYSDDRIEEDDSVFVRMKKNKKINPIGAGTYMDFPDGIQQDEFVLVPVKKNNQCNPIGANIDFPDEIEEDDSVYVLVKTFKKINPIGTGTYMDFPDGIEEVKFVFVPVKKKNQCNPIGANIDIPAESLSFPIQETGFDPYVFENVVSHSYL